MFGSKLLVLYVFHMYNERVKHFIEHAIFEDKSVDFIIICNDKKCVFEVPLYVKKIMRDNVGIDFGGWSDALMQNNLYQNYNKFIFANSSVIGPFLDPKFDGKWTDMYIRGLRGNTKLFGSTINTIGKPLTKSHVQSYIFCMDKITLEFLIANGIFSTKKYARNMRDAILNKEILMSTLILKNGWNIGSLLSCYKDVDFTFAKKKPEEYDIAFLGDIMNQRYKGTLWNEKELVFIKGNRHIIIKF